MSGPIMICKVSNAVMRFSEAAGDKINAEPGFNNETGLNLELVREEYKELLAAIGFAQAYGQPQQFADILDACCDLVWVTVRLAHNMGLPFDEGFELVRITNMAKIGPNGKVQRREDGKILKPVGWKAPDLLSLIQEKLDGKA